MHFEQPGTTNIMSSPKLYNRTPSRGASLADLHELAILWAEDTFDKRGDIPFMWLLDTGKEILWIETQWKDESEKHASFAIIAIICRELNIIGYSVAIEAWVAVETAPKGTTAAEISKKKDFRLPSNRPKSERDDVMVVSTIGKNGEQMATRYLVTDRRHKKNLLGPRVDEWEAGGLFSGNLFEIFQPHCPMCKSLIGHKEKCPAHDIARVFTKGEPL